MQAETPNKTIDQHKLTKLPSGNYLLVQPTEDEFAACQGKHRLYGICVSNGVRYWDTELGNTPWSKDHAEYPRLFTNIATAQNRSHKITEREKCLPVVKQAPWRPMIWISRDVDYIPLSKYVRMSESRGLPGSISQ